MPSLNVPNAILHYNVEGEGPVLLLIAGARGTGTVFARVVPLLSKSFSVITYDRRGHSQSYLTGEQDYSHRLERDADDAAELIEHVSKERNSKSPIYVFGTSSGAIVTSCLIRRHFNLFEKVICHEPPLMNALTIEDGRDEEITATKATYAEYRAKGPITALQAFSRINIAPEELQALRSLANPSADPYAAGNIAYWFERELPVYPLIEMPWSELEKAEIKSRLIMGFSTTGSQLPAARAARNIGTKLNVDVTQFPGGHLGYLTHPEEFDDALRKALKL